jgi:hypothetical protein
MMASKAPLIQLSQPCLDIAPEFQENKIGSQIPELGRPAELLVPTRAPSEAPSNEQSPESCGPTTSASSILALVIAASAVRPAK